MQWFNYQTDAQCPCVKTEFVMYVGTS